MIQVGAWVMQGLAPRPTLDGQGVNVVSCHWRFLGAPAASGARRVIFTLQEVDHAERVMVICAKWWAEDPSLAKGWRWCAVRWMQPKGWTD